MYPVKTTVQGLPRLNYPDVEQMFTQAFCKCHCEFVRSKGIPTDLYNTQKHQVYRSNVLPNTYHITLYAEISSQGYTTVQHACILLCLSI